MRHRAREARAFALLFLTVGCAAIAGLEDDYALVPATGGSGGAGSSNVAGSHAQAGAGQNSGGAHAGTGGSNDAGMGNSSEGGKASLPPGGAAGDGGAASSDAGAPGSAGAGGAPEMPVVCNVTCEAPKPACVNGTCQAPTSCAGLKENCGPSFATSCCGTIQVPGGSFKRDYDAVNNNDDSNPATVSSFSLDAMEVTVGRFRKFVEAGFGNQKAPPAVGAGEVGAHDGTGWKTSFNDSLPDNKAALVSALNCDKDLATWTDVADTRENRPVNCVTWYEAFAFCIYEGGRLPTQAEWNYAAAGGNQQRVYPWSTPATSQTINSTLASYWVDATKLCYGDGKNGCTRDDITVAGQKTGLTLWGHADMAGNLAEWVFDYNSDSYKLPCADCAQTNASPYRVRRGGAYSGDSLAVAVIAPDYASPTERSTYTGFRCAYRN